MVAIAAIGAIAWGGLLVFYVTTYRRLKAEREAVDSIMASQQYRITVLEGELSRAAEHCKMADELADELYMEYAEEVAAEAEIEYTLRAAARERSNREQQGEMPYWGMRLNHWVLGPFSKS